MDGELMGSPSASEVLADFVLRIHDRGLAGDERVAGRTIFLDCLGGAMAGATSRATRFVHQYLSDLGVSSCCTVLGTAAKAIPEHAALANGLAAHVLDLDDTNSTMDGHPSVSVLPSSLALAEACRRSGGELLTAFVLGFEVQAKLASVLHRNHWSLGWHTAGTLGSIGATASAAFLLDLKRDQTVHALGIAASMASGLSSNIGSMVKPLHPGLAARNGVLAAELAARGFEAQPDAIEGPHGFARAFTGLPDFVLDSSAPADRLGNPFDLVRPGTDIKLYPSCNYTHAAIDACLGLQAQARAGRIDRVICRVPHVPRFLLTRFPRNSTEGKFSLEYCIALALTKTALQLEDFEDGPIADEAVSDLIQRVRVQSEPRMPLDTSSSGLPAEITVHFVDGSSVTDFVRAPRGSTVHPLSDREIDEKFLRLTRRVSSSF